jgi:hypothetical protein
MSTSIGASIHVHYCMGRITDWGFEQNDAKTCGKCGMEKSIKKSNGCCKDEYKYLKNNTDQKNLTTDFQMAQQEGVAVPVSFYELPSVDFPSVTEENPISHAPPRDCGVAVYIRNCVFRI